MGIKQLFKSKNFIGISGFICWSLIFGIIYAQSPLFSSNQNRYFLNGLANAGFGYLDHDWLANTFDALPLFSLLVQGTYLVFRSNYIHYLYYALLLGVYLVGILGIVDDLFNIRQSRRQHLIFLTIFLGVHSAAFHFTLSRILGTEQPYLLEGGVASQRLLGQVFQPSSFGVFLILSIFFFIRRRSLLSLLSLSIAVSFHSVYLLTAAFLVIGYTWTIFREKRNIKEPFLFGLGALLLVSPVVVHTFMVFKPTSPEIAQQVNEILVGFRNPQHADISSWLDWSVVVQSVLVIGALFVVRKKAIFSTLAIVLFGLVLLTVVQVLTQSDTLALLYPWRMSVVLVPVSTSILLAYGVNKFVPVKQLDASKQGFLISFSCLIILTGLLIIGIVRFQVETLRQINAPSRPLMEYVSVNKSADDVYLVPVKMEDFRLVTGAPSYIDFKSVAYRDLEVLEWYRRFNLANLFYQRSNCEVLQQVYQEGVTHVVIPSEFSSQCTDVDEIYRDENYGLFVLLPGQ